MSGPGSAAIYSDYYAGYEHGTHVAGIAAGNNKAARTGVAKGANIIAVQVFTRFPKSECQYYGYDSAPFTPHLAEELWEMSGGEGLVSIAGYPEAAKFAQDKDAEAAEEYLKSVQQDISDILKMTGMKPSKICLYTAHGWKYDIQQKMAAGANMGEIMKEAMADPEMQKLGKQVSSFAGRLQKDAKKGTLTAINHDSEFDTLKSASEFFSKEYDCEFSVYAGDDAEAYDPSNKRNVAGPGKPGIHAE